MFLRTKKLPSLNEIIQGRELTRVATLVEMSIRSLKSTLFSLTVENPNQPTVLCSTDLLEDGFTSSFHQFTPTTGSLKKTTIVTISCLRTDNKICTLIITEVFIKNQVWMASSRTIFTKN